MVLEFDKHHKRASPDLSIYIYSSTYLHAYISCLHGISCSDPHLEHHCFEHSSLSLSQILPHEMDCQIPKPYVWQNDRSWLMVLEFGQHRKRARPDISIYIYLSISVSICLYIYIYKYIYIYTYISCLHGNSCSDPHLEHQCFEHSSLSLKYLPMKWIVK